MSDTPQTPPPSSPQSNPEPIKPKREKRWWLRIVLGLVVIILLLIVFAPTIASMGFVRSIVLGKVNDNLNGKVALDDLSLGWFSGIKLQGLVVSDPNGNKVVTLDKVTTGLTVLDVVKGNFALGNVVIDGLHADVRIDQNNHSNLESIAKPSPVKETTAAKTSGAPGKLPNVSGNITLTNSSVTIQKAGLPEIVNADLKGNVKIPDINSPINNSLDVGLKVGSQPAGNVALSGKIAAIKNNQVLQDLNQMVINETVTIQGIILSALRPFAPATVENLQGQIDGQLAAKLDKGGTIDGKVVMSNLLVQGPILNGDAFKTSTLALSLPHVQVTSDSGAIIAGQEQGSDPISVTFDQGSVSVRTATTLKMLKNLAAMVPPGEPGNLRADLKLDLAMLAAQLPHTLRLLPDVQIQSANLVAYDDIQVRPTEAVIKQHIELPNGIKGQNTKTNAPVQVSPIVFDSNATDLGKTGNQVLPDLRDVLLTFTSSFASADFRGQSLAAINGKASGDLAKMKSELGQVINFGDTQMQGTFDATLATNGDLASTSPVDLNAGITFHNLQIASAGKPAISQPWINATLAGKLKHDKTDVIAVNGVQVTARTGNEQSPTVDLLATADVDLTTKATSFDLQKLMVDLAKAQSEFAALLGQGNGAIRSGTLSAAAKGTYDGQAAHLISAHIAPANITIDRNGTAILQNYAATIDIADATLDAKNKSATINQFAMDDGNRMLTVHSAQGAPIAVKMPDSGLPVANVKLDLTAKVAPLMELVNSFKPSTQPASELHWTSGEITSQLAVETDNATKTIKLNLPSLAGKDIAFQRGSSSYKTDFTSAVAASVTPEGSAIKDVTVSQLDLKSPLATIGLSKQIVIQNLSGLLSQLSAAAGAPAPTANASASGGIHITGDLAAVKQFLDAWQGTTSAQSPAFAGNLDVTETFGTQGSTISLTGDGGIANLSVKQTNSNASFTEPSVKISNDIALDHGNDSVTIKTVALSMATSKALDLNVTGAIQSLSKQRDLKNIVINLNYDAGKLWQIIRPFLPPDQQQKTAKWVVAGTQQRQITINGSYPAGVASTEAIKSLDISGGIGLGTLQGDGLDVEQLSQPFTLKNGLFTLVTPTSPAAATQPGATAIVNNGTLHLGGATVNLATTKPLFNCDNLSFTKDVSINPVLAQNFMSFSPLFAGADQAAGKLNIQVTKAKDVAVTDLTGPSSGHADLAIDLQNVQIVNQLLSQLTQFIGGDPNGFTGHIYSKQLTFDNGVVTQDIIFELGQYNLEFKGGVGLKNLDLRNFQIIIPGELLAKIPKYGSALSNLKGGIPITLNGTATHPQLPSLPQFVSDVVKRNVTNNPLGAVEGILGGASGSKSNNQQQGGNNNNNSPINAIENLLGGGGRNSSSNSQQQQQQQQQQKSKPNQREPATKPTSKPASPLRDLRNLFR